MIQRRSTFAAGLAFIITCYFNFSTFAQVSVDNTAAPEARPAAQLVKPPQNIYARKQTDLSGEWAYIIDPLERPLKRASSRWDFYKNELQTADGRLVEYDWSVSPKITVPGDWNKHSEELKWYNGLVWYYREINFKPAANERAILHFEAANYRAHVYLNGQLLGEHEGGYTPFAFDVTDKLKDKNFLVVGVNSKHTNTTIPGPDFDWWNYGGLTRPVSIITLPETYVSDYLVRYDAKQNSFVGFVQAEGTRKADASVQLAISELNINQTVRTDSNGRAEIKIAAPRTLKLWSPEQPKLYNITLKHNGEEIKDEIAFRTIETRGTDILLNGKSIYLRGICLHEEALGEPTRTLTWETGKQLLDYAKELNANFVRLAHYPHTEKMTRLADRMGLLVWSEVPVYQGFKGEIDFGDAKTLSVAKQMLLENYERDKNRGSIIVWSIANETPVSPERNAFLKALADHVHAFDSTRLVSAALDTVSTQGNDILVDDEVAQYMDLLAVNTYVGWYGDGLPDIIKTRNWKIAVQKPLIFSEFGADAPFGNRGSRMTRWTEEYQDFMFQETLKNAARHPFVKGTTPWILKDFRSPRRWHARYQNYWNRKGIISNTGERKLAFKTLQDWYKDIAAR